MKKKTIFKKINFLKITKSKNRIFNKIKAKLLLTEYLTLETNFLKNFQTKIKNRKIDFFNVLMPFLISGAVFFEFSEKNCTYLYRRFEKNRILIKNQMFFLKIGILIINGPWKA